MNEIIKLSQTIKSLSEQRDKILPEIEKLPKEYIELVSKFKLVSDTLAQLQHQFDALTQKVLQQK